VRLSTATVPSTDELLQAALAGDQTRFGLLVAPYVRELHVHCYRMLGSFHDAEDATQETLLRAWRHLHTFQGRGPLRAWLYRIATTTCLKLLKSRQRRRDAARPNGAQVPFLEPYPDRLLDELPHDGPDPAAVAERRESVALAFVVALQQLTARQRAVLVLREVLGWRAAEVADLLETSVPAVNSALQRARATLGQARPPAGISARSLPVQEQDLLHRFMLAWQRRDIEGLAALLREDAVLHMPPQSLRYLGRQGVARFFGAVPAGGRLDHTRLVATRANGHPALAAYLPAADGSYRAYGVMVLVVAEGGIQAITGFQDASLFHAFGLPQTPSGPLGPPPATRSPGRGVRAAR
jgi:RNA polymerase sigma-70 factor (ECF subfamily)